MQYAFRLRSGFPKTEMEDLAIRCAFGDQDELLVQAGRRSRAAGYYTRADFVLMCKSTMTGKLGDSNSEQHIERSTRIALNTISERDRIGSLMLLGGVSWRTASVVLHYTFEDQYPTIAQRVLWSWGFDHAPTLSFEFWWGYVEASRTVCSECCVPMRNLDRALRQYALEQRSGEYRNERRNRRSGTPET